ncbi:methionyl-tRNA formyltransferase [bacterium]|nr:methionyl-tRNA formyltransferase [bacterium]
MTLQVVFFGDSESVFSNRHFRALRRSDGAIAAVVDTPPARRTSTNKDETQGSRFTQAAAGLGIPVFDPDNPNDPSFVRAVRRLKPDLFLAVGYSVVLKPEILFVPRLGAVNLHASLLPAYRGKHPVFWALRQGEPRAGLTAHLMDPRLDAGDVLCQVSVRTRRDDSVAALYDRIMDRSESLVPRLIAAAAAGRLRPRPQPAAGASYYSSTREEDFRLDWTRDAEQLRRWICASPGRCFFEVAGPRVFVLSAAGDRCGAGSAPPGTLVRLGRRHGVVATGRGCLRVGEVREGDAPSEWMAGWCRRREIAAGDRVR